MARLPIDGTPVFQEFKRVRKWIRSLIWFLPLGLFVAAGVYSMLPQPVAVETVVLQRSPMDVTVNQSGITRVRERYQVSSPVAGQLMRIKLRSGDPIRANETLLATIEPSDPSMLDARQVAETEARASAAKVFVDRAQARLDQTRVAQELAETQLKRMYELRQSQAISVQEYDAAEARFRSSSEDLRVANYELEIARFEYQQARAALMTVQPADGRHTTNFEIKSPIDGAVLRVFQESSIVVTPGMGLMQVGNPHDLEVIIDVLSTDAVKIAPGNEIRLLHWGGDENLKAVVRVVEPAAFTKISALGIEEQRVNVIGDFYDQQAILSRLGDGFRVEAEIVVWHDADVLQVPTAALFRVEGAWSVFVIEQGIVSLRSIEIGKRNALAAEVLQGLAAGEQVIVYPSDLVREGVSAVSR